MERADLQRSRRWAGWSATGAAALRANSLLPRWLAIAAVGPSCLLLLVLGVKLLRG